MYGTANDISTVILRSFEVMLLLTLVPLAALAVVGVILSLLLSILQINDQALPVAVKLVTVIVVVLVIGGWMSQTLITLSSEIFAVMQRI
jgi:type III secretion protein S